MRLTIQFFLVLFFLSNNLYSQNDVFTVLISNGKNECFLNNNWSELMPGYTINKTVKIRTAKGCYLLLVSDKKKTLEIITEGEFNYDNLLKISQSNMSLSEKLVSFLSKKVLTAPSEQINSNKLAAVVREPGKGDKIIELYFPNFTYILDLLTFKWFKYQNESTYCVKITNSDKITVFKKVVEGTMIIINPKEMKLQKETEYNISVVSYSDKNICSNWRTFKIPDDDKELKDTIKTVQSQNNKDSFLSKLLIASILERNSFNLEAEKYYSENFNLIKNNQKLLDLYNEFLINVGYIKDPNQLLKIKK